MPQAMGIPVPAAPQATAAAAQVIAIDPVTRLEGHLKIQVSIDTVNGKQQVVDAWSTGTLFRGFEAILVGRHPWDAQHITQRVCGVCPVSHGLAAVEAVDAITKIAIPNNARVMRNLVLGSNFVASHILQFYHLTAPDFIDGPAMPPWQPSWSADKRFDSVTTGILVNHYVTALDMRRKAQEMGALFGGRLPNPPAYIPGGFTTTVRADRVSRFKTYLNDLIGFIDGTYIPDVEALASVYDEYSAIGKGWGNLLAYGVFDLDAAGPQKLLARGRRVAASPNATIPIEIFRIAEDVTHSWYAPSAATAPGGLPPASGVTTPQYPKSGAYSWLKAPRYAKGAYEVGALARMTVNGDYPYSVSVMDRHLARAQEASKIAHAMQSWVSQLVVNGPVFATNAVPVSGTAYGLTEAPRGALGHWVQIANSKIARYQIVTPTCWNASPRDSMNRRGPIVQALIGMPVANIDQPIEVVRLIHSFDPCLSCAVHVMRPKEEARIITLNM